LRRRHVAAVFQSELFARIAKLQLELPAFKHHHAAEFIPGDLSTVDANHWDSIFLVGIGLIEADSPALSEKIAPGEGG
jgi:hypothetical protein